MIKPTLVILAAGIGSRYGGLKQMDRVGPSGETIIDYSIYDAIRAGFGKIVFVIRREIEDDFKEAFIDKLSDKIEVDYVFQEIDMVPPGIEVSKDRNKPWGTAHAILVAENKVKEPFAVINADDFYGSKSFHTVAEFLKGNQPESEYSMVGFQLDKTLSEHGQVARGVCEENSEAYLEGVVERTNIVKSPEGIMFRDENDQPVYLSGSETVSMNFWGFQPSVFAHLNSYFAKFVAEFGNDPKKEFFIPIMIMDLIHKGVARVKVLQSGENWFGVTYKEDKEAVMQKLREKVDNGVYPENLWG